MKEIDLTHLYDNLVHSFGIEGLEIPTTFIKIYKQTDTVPDAVWEHHPDSISLTSCQAVRQASTGDAICLSKENIGCIAAAISLGLVDQNDPNPLKGPRVYTDLMREQYNEKNNFVPPSPKDFTDGLVYACHAAGKKEFCLFGEKDSGRFKDVDTAKAAVAEMTAIQPATTQAVFFYSKDYDLEPDLVLCDVRPVELTRIIQAFQYDTGKRVIANMGGLRAVGSDLIARPYLEQQINVSSYCLGSRIIAQYEAERLGLAMPFKIFETIVDAMQRSQNGFPFHMYPSAGDF